MYGNQQVRSLEEDFKEMGLDPVRVKGDIARNTQLMEDRTGPGNGGGVPSYVSGQGAAPAGGEPGEVTEALKVVKKLIKTSGEKLKEKRARKKGRSAAKKASKAYYKAHRRAIAKRRKKKLAKFGGAAGLAKIHAQGRRIVMSDSTELANLRESIIGGGQTSEQYEPFELAAYHAGEVAASLGDIFEAAGDIEVAEVMRDTSDAAAELSVALAGVTEADELDADQQARFEKVIESVTRGMKMYEGMGAPSIPGILQSLAAEAGTEAAAQ